MDAGDVALFSCFDLCVDSIDDMCFLVFTLRKFPKDAESIDYAAGREFYGTAVMPFL